MTTLQGPKSISLYLKLIPPMKILSPKECPNLITVAIHTDKFVSISEKEFYQHIKHLLYISLPEIRDLHLKLGQELQKRDRRVRLWKELGNLGNTLNARRGMYYWYYPYDTFDVLLLMSWLGESLFSGKMKYVIYALLIALGLFVFPLNVEVGIHLLDEVDASYP